MILFFALAAHAGEAGGSASVNLHLSTRCEVVADCRLLDFQDLVVLRGFFAEQPVEGVGLYLEGALRLDPAPDAEEVGATSNVQRVQPLTLEVPEAWVELEVAPAVDVRVGQQRFAWGVGLGVNPVDVVNPYDLRDPTRFDQRLGTPAVSARLHHEQAGLELVWLPLFRPARMPVEIDLLEDADDLFDFSDVGGGDVDLGELETRTTFPDDRLGFQSFAARASLAAPVADLALVFFHGRDSLPQVGGTAVLVGFPGGNRVDVGIPVVYPRMTLLGAEVRAPLFWELGAWAEVALVLPERVVVTASRAQLEALVDLGAIEEVPDPLPETVIQDGEPIPRWVVGIDRLLGRFSLAAQWIHGLPHERRAEELSDYAALSAAVTLADPVQLRLAGLSDGRGWLAGAHLAVLHRDTATVTLGATLVDGPDGSALGQLRQVSNATLGVKLPF